MYFIYFKYTDKCCISLLLVKLSFMIIVILLVYYLMNVSGNVHGKYKNIPMLDFDRMAAIRRESIKAAAARYSNGLCLLVLHGASGLSEDIIAKVS